MMIIIIKIIIMIITIIITTPHTMKYLVGVRQGIVCLMGRKNSSDLVGSLSRDGVLINYWWLCNVKFTEASNE